MYKVKLQPSKLSLHLQLHHTKTNIIIKLMERNAVLFSFFSLTGDNLLTSIILILRESNKKVQACGHTCISIPASIAF